MGRSLLVSLLCLCALVSLAAAASDRLAFRANGFSIAPLEGVSDRAPYQALIMFLPSSDGFAPNVNVQIQPYRGSIDDYAALSREQAEDAGLTTIEETKRGSAGLAIEYAGTLEGRQLHFYARAELEGRKVYLVTATATEGQWPSLSRKLMSCVDSFTLTKR